MSRLRYVTSPKLNSTGSMSGTANRFEIRSSGLFVGVLRLTSRIGHGPALTHAVYSWVASHRYRVGDPVRSVESLLWSTSVAAGAALLSNRDYQVAAKLRQGVPDWYQAWRQALGRLKVWEVGKRPY